MITDKQMAVNDKAFGFRYLQLKKKLLICYRCSAFRIYKKYWLRSYQNIGDFMHI